MKSDVIHIHSTGEGIHEALMQTERVAAFKALDKKNTIHLRLFAEEMMGMMKTLTGEQEADFWIEVNGNQYLLHLLVNTAMDADKRERLLAVSTSGKNDVKGFMAKVKSAIEAAVSSMESGYSYNVGRVIAGNHGNATFHEWTLTQYKDQAQKEDWDELEQSIVARLANEVRVRITGSDVEMTIEKTI